MSSNNIHINPSFIPKSKSNIHLNPLFVNSLKKNTNDSSNNVYTNSNHYQQPYYSNCEAKKVNREHEMVSEGIDLNHISTYYINDSNSLLKNNKPKVSKLYIKPSFFTSQSAYINVCTNSLPKISAAKSQDVTGSSENSISLAKNHPQNHLLHSHYNKYVYNIDQSKITESELVVRQTNSKSKQEKILKKNKYSINNGSFNSSKYKILNKNYKKIGATNTKYSLDKRYLRQSNQSMKIVSSFNNENDTTKELKQEKVIVEDNNKFASYKVDFQLKKETLPKTSLMQKCHFESNSYKKNKMSDTLNSTLHQNNLKEFDFGEMHSLPNRSNVENPAMSCNSLINDRSLNSTSKPITTFSQSLKLNNKPCSDISKIKDVSNIYTEQLRKQNRRNSFAVKTKTRLIRRKSIDSKFKKNNLGLNNFKVRKITPIKRSFIIRGREHRSRKSFVSNFQRISVLHSEGKSVKSKYKLINNGKATNQVSKYKIIRNPSKSLQTTFSFSSNLNSRVKRGSLAKKSDKFINIEGNLYKSTRTSLKKQDLSQKSNKKKIFNPKAISKKSSPRNSKFVYRRQNSSDLQSGTLIEIVRRKKLAHLKRVNEYCFFYNKYGRCKKMKKGCPFLHDPTRVAVCTRFLRGSCAVKDCPFSHTHDRNKMPVCSHFLEGSCNRETCPYRHVRVNPKAPFCRNFLKGHCPLGEECKKKHILICEEFKADGVCPRGKNCPLSHRKSKTPLRKARRKLSISSTSSSTSSSCKKKSKNKKRLAHKNAKIGVLGLGLAADEEKNTKLASGKGGSSTVCTTQGRYFDCEAKPSENDPTSPESERKNQETQDDSAAPISNGLEEKRIRLLEKIEQMKRNYKEDGLASSNSSDTHEDYSTNSDRKNGPRETLMDTLEADVRPGKERPCESIDSRPLDDKNPSPEIIKLKFRSLPAILPSFIPLLLPEDSDED